MEGLVWLVVLCVLAAMMLLALGLCRRLLSQELPEELAALALLHERDGLELYLDALAAQVLWTDSDLVQTVWLVDCTEDGCLELVCTDFCRTHSGFRYCRVSELVKIFGKMREAEKNDCISSKKHV